MYENLDNKYLNDKSFNRKYFIKDKSYKFNENPFIFLKNEILETYLTKRLLCYFVNQYFSLNDKIIYKINDSKKEFAKNGTYFLRLKNEKLLNRYSPYNFDKENDYKIFSKYQYEYFDEEPFNEKLEGFTKKLITRIENNKE